MSVKKLESILYNVNEQISPIEVQGVTIIVMPTTEEHIKAYATPTHAVQTDQGPGSGCVGGGQSMMKILELSIVARIRSFDVGW